MDISVTQDMGRTGNFIVTLKNTNEVLHDKIKQNKGRCEEDEEREVIVKAIEEFASKHLKKA